MRRDYLLALLVSFLLTVSVCLLLAWLWSYLIPPVPTPQPTATPFTVLHTVQRGESLCSIALAAYGACGQWGKVWEANGRFRKPHLIQPGQELVIPSD